MRKTVRYILVRRWWTTFRGFAYSHVWKSNPEDNLIKGSKPVSSNSTMKQFVLWSNFSLSHNFWCVTICRVPILAMWNALRVGSGPSSNKKIFATSLTQLYTLWVRYKVKHIMVGSPINLSYHHELWFLSSHSLTPWVQFTQQSRL